LTTNTGRSVEVGNSGSSAEAKAFTALSGAHLFALRGNWGPGCAGPAVEFVWGTEKCEAPAPPPALAETPAPAPAPEPVPMPVPVPTPTPVRLKLLAQLHSQQGLMAATFSLHHCLLT